MPRLGDDRGDVAPEEGAGPEAVEEDDRGPPVAVPLDVYGAGADGDAENVSLHERVNSLDYGE